MRILLSLIFVLAFLGCTTIDSNNTNQSVSRPTSDIESNSEPQTPTLDIPGQLARIAQEGSDDEAIRKNIQDADKSITYEHLKKNADKYAGKPWAFRGKIIQIQENNGETVALVSIDGWGNKNVWVSGDLTTEFIENNQVYVVGYLAGNYSYTSTANWQITIPAVAMRAMMKPNESAKYQFPTKKK